jgi:hypothetical protein
MDELESKGIETLRMRERELWRRKQARIERNNACVLSRKHFNEAAMRAKVDLNGERQFKRYRSSCAGSGCAFLGDCAGRFQGAHRP